MKSYTKELWFNISSRMDFINISHDVERCVQEAGIQEGLCLVNSIVLIKHKCFRVNTILSIRRRKLFNIYVLPTISFKDFGLYLFTHNFLNIY